MRRSCSSRWLALLVTCSVWMAPVLAFAGDPARALQYYEQAKQAYGDGNFKLAAEFLERAYAEDANLIYQYNRVRALQNMGEYEAALKVINIYKSPMLRDPEARFTDIEAIEAQIRAEMAKVSPPKEDPPKEDPPKEDPPKEDPPKDPPKEDPPQPDPPKTEPEGTSTNTIVGWSLIGVGGASLGASAIFGSGLLLSERPPDDAEQSVRDQFDDELAQQKLITTVTLVTGTVLIGTGVVFLLLDDDPDEGVSFLPQVGTTQAGAAVHFRF